MKKKNEYNQKPVNKWKITAVISLIINGIIALLLIIGFANPKVEKASAYLGYDNSKIITNSQKIDSNIDYYLYFDWDNRDLGSGVDYYFPLSNSVPVFEYWYSLPIEHQFSNEEYQFNALFIRKQTSTSDIDFTLYGYVNSEQRYMLVSIAKIVYQNEPQSYLLDFSAYGVQETSSEVREYFKSLFDGSLRINYSEVSEGIKFVVGYFSQYSVQVLSLKKKFESYQNLFNTIYFESEYSFEYHEQVDIRFLQSTLFFSVGQPFFDSSNTNYNDYGYQICLSGIFKVGENTYTGLAWVWKEFDLSSYYSVSYNDFMISRGISQNHYYYLDSLCPYDSGNEEVILDKPLFIFHDDSYINQNDYSGGLSMTLSCVSVNQNFINALNLYSEQNVWWSNITTLFEVKNYFSFYNGEVNIDTPIDTDISSYNGGQIGNVFVLISGAFESLIPLLSVVILPGITLGMLVFIPIIAIVIIVVIKLVKR